MHKNYIATFFKYFISEKLFVVVELMVYQRKYADMTAKPVYGRIILYTRAHLQYI